MLFKERALLSISMIALIVLALFQVHFTPIFRITIRKTLVNNLKILRDRKDFLALTIFFFLIVLSAPYSTQHPEYLLERFTLKLPFLGLPLAFISLPKISYKDFIGFHYVLIFFIFLASIYTMVYYGLDYENITHNIGMGKHLPTPCNHIRFSLIIAYAILVGILILFRKDKLSNTNEHYGIGIVTLWLFAFIHILAVRSGLFFMYIGIFILTCLYIYQSKAFLKGLFIICLLGIIPVTTYFIVPSFKNKILYTVYDLRMYQENTGKNYNDSQRLYSIATGLKIAKDHPIIGVGAGDLKYQVIQYYKEKHPDFQEINIIMPHNQFLTFFAGTGIIGLLLGIIAFFTPIIYNKNYQNIFFLSFYILIFLSFLVENTIENALGISIYLLITLLCLKANTTNKYQLQNEFKH